MRYVLIAALLLVAGTVWAHDGFICNPGCTTIEIDNGDGTHTHQLTIERTHPDPIAPPVNQPPIANAGPDQNVTTGAVVQLDGSGSSDADGDPFTYQWSLSAPAGSSATLSDPFLVNPAFTADVAGLYTASLVVSDGVDSPSDSVAVTAVDPMPPPSGGIPGSFVNFIPNSGEWKEITGTAIAPVLIKRSDIPTWCDSINCDQSQNAIYAWTSAAYDPVSFVWYVPAGGGHADYGGNEVYSFDFKTLTWTRDTEPQQLTGPPINTGSCPAPASGMPATHHYDGVVWVPSLQKIMVLGSFPYCNQGLVWEAQAWDYAPDGTWTRRAELDDAAEFAMTDILPDGNLIVYRKDRALVIDPETGATVRASNVWGSWGDGNGVYHPDGNFYFIKWSGGETLMRLKVHPAFDGTDPTTIGPLPAGVGGNGAIAVHSSGKLVMWGGQKQIVTYDPVGGAWETLTPTLGPGRAFRSIFAKWVYIPEHDVFAGYNDVDEGVWLYKLPGGEAAPIQPPTDPVVVIPGPSPDPAPDASFAELCDDPNVVLCDPMDAGRVSGVGVKPNTPCATMPEALNCGPENWRSASWPGGEPTYDPTVGTGSGSFRCSFVGKSAENCAMGLNFTPDGSVKFGENETFYVRWKQRFSCDVIYMDCDPSSPTYKTELRHYPGTGYKLLMVDAGDHPNERSGIAPSCTWLEIVWSQGTDHAVSGYHACGWYEGFTAELPGANFDYQPGGPNQCLMRWVDDGGNFRKGTVWGNSDPDCYRWDSDKWYTFTMRVDVGPWQPDRLGDPASNIKMWVAEESAEPTPVVDHKFYNRGPEPDAPWRKYGKLHITNFMTRKNPALDHPTGYTWYDEIIISKGSIGGLN